ncbi:MAG: hypothetical protein WCP34_07385 [Pseudomonadota bacterium]
MKRIFFLSMAFLPPLWMFSLVIAAQSGSRLADSMANMMDTFGGMLKEEKGNPANESRSFGTGTYPMPSMPGMGTMPGMGAMPGMGSGSWMERPPVSPGNWLPRAGDLQNPLFPQLDGWWEGSAGDRMVIQGTRFRIYASTSDYVEGRFNIQGNYLALQNQDSGVTQVYEFAHHSGRLALRNPDGQLMLYRRMAGDGSGSAVP